jgi:CheY-like chemotaxis protein
MTQVDLSNYRKLYIKVAKEYVDKILTSLVKLIGNPSDKESINILYISSHSLVSQSQVMKFENIANISASIEKTSKDILEGRLNFDANVAEVLKKSAGEISLSIGTIEKESTEKNPNNLVEQNNTNVKNNLKILIIEDDEFIQKFYSTKLLEQQVQVQIASNGEEGLAKMKEFNPNLVLLDLIMPKMDGFAVLNARSQDEVLRKIPVVVFSTLGQEKDVQNAQKLGANGYINKGFFDFNSMITTINNVMKSG